MRQMARRARQFGNQCEIHTTCIPGILMESLPAYRFRWAAAGAGEIVDNALWDYAAQGASVNDRIFTLTYFTKCCPHWFLQSGKVGLRCGRTWSRGCKRGTGNDSRTQAILESNVVSFKNRPIGGCLSAVPCPGLQSRPPSQVPGLSGTLRPTFPELDQVAANQRRMVRPLGPLFHHPRPRPQPLQPDSDLRPRRFGSSAGGSGDCCSKSPSTKLGHGNSKGNLPN